MAALTRREYERLLACIARLHACDDLSTFPDIVLGELPGLVGTDHITFNYVAPATPRAVVVGSPHIPGHEERERVFARYLGDQPILKHYLATGDPGAYKLSDFLTEREYHALGLYEHVYRELQYEDQFAFLLFPPGAEMVAIALARGRRSFTEHDRVVLNAVRPHVAVAYRRAEKLGLLARALRPDGRLEGLPLVAAVVLDAGQRPVRCDATAQQWLARFFPGQPRQPGGLPDGVAAWLRRGNGKTGGAHPDVLTRERGSQRLSVRLWPAWEGPGFLLVLDLETVRGAAYASLAGLLTRREIDVLLEVEQGRTNDEAAAALGISPLTVRTHLEHIFEKLRVSTRTAAVARFRQLCAGTADRDT